MMNELSLVHLVREPLVKEAQPPLLILLHGFGSNEEDLYGMVSYLDKRFLIVSARAPNILGPQSYGWFDVNFTPRGSDINPAQAEESRQKLIHFIDEVVKAYGANPKQVYLMGFSQGAIMSASIALTRPDLVAGAVLMSGRVLPEIQPSMASPEQLQGLSFLVVHGTFDNVLPIQNGRASREILSSLPVQMTYHEYPMGHEVSHESITDVANWLSAQLDKSE